MIPLRANPSRLTFRNVDRNADVLQGTVMLKRGDGGPIKPRVIKGKKGIETAIREIEPGERYELEVTITRPYPNGPLKKLLQLGTGVEEVPETSFLILADIPPRVNVLPRQFTLPPLIEEPFEQSVELNWVETTAYKVLRVETNIAELTARVEEKDGRQVVILHAPPGYKRAKGTFPGVTIHTDDPDLPTLRVPVNTGRPSRRGTGVRSPDRGAANRMRPSRSVTP